MIRFTIGLFTVIAGVAAVEGTAPLGHGVMISTLGIMIMLWGIIGMKEKGDLS